jgi:alpha-glucosidase
LVIFVLNVFIWAMKIMRHVFLLFILALSHVAAVYGQNVIPLHSPDGKITLNIKTSDFFEIELVVDSVTVMDFSRISLSIEGEQILGLNPKVKKRVETAADQNIIPVVAEKYASIRENYNELQLICKGDYQLNLRAFNNGIAWQFETAFKEKITVNREQILLNFPDNSHIWFPEEDSFFSHNERYYLYEQIDLISSHRFCSLPALVEPPSGCKLLIMESGLKDYPGRWMRGTGSHALRGVYAGVVLEEEQLNDRDVRPAGYAQYLAVTEGTRKFPWRIIGVAREDKNLVTNQLTYLLADTCHVEDVSWIRPGKVAWDWWNAWNIYGVDFRAGVNTDTYKYYIDFASRNGIEYIIMDEGWYELGDLMAVKPEIDMEEIIAYGKEKNVEVILWVIWKTLDDQWDEAFDQFEKWGVSGLKVDFMQRDDQWMVNYYWRIAEEAARRKMVVDFHGSYKPSGLRRAFPNVLTREGVRGLEQSKWSDKNTPDHNLILPFIRMASGPMEYTPGAMVNATKENFRPVYTQPMSMGTRSHQLAMYVVYESPLQMLCDNPSKYMAEPECTEFLASVPVVWDTTIILSASIGDHIAVARKKDKDWYIGCMTNWEPRELELNFSFLEPGKHEIEIWQDGINADRYASDYKKVSMKISSGVNLKIKMAPGGGWAAIVHGD